MTGKRWLVAGVAVLAVAWLARGCWHRLPFAGPRQEQVSHSLIVERVRDVARLATSETTVRDVLVYRDTWLGSTKQSLVVVTGVVSAGISLDSANVLLDGVRHRIVVALPPARILSVDIRDLRTYDERSGLWNRFTPADRDRVYQLALQRLEQAAGELDILPRADASARALLTRLLATEGWEVVMAGERLQPVLPNE